MMMVVVVVVVGGEVRTCAERRWRIWPVDCRKVGGRCWKASADGGSWLRAFRGARFAVRRSKSCSGSAAVKIEEERLHGAGVGAGGNGLGRRRREGESKRRDQRTGERWGKKGSGGAGTYLRKKRGKGGGGSARGQRAWRPQSSGRDRLMVPGSKDGGRGPKWGPGGKSPPRPPARPHPSFALSSRRDTRQPSSQKNAARPCAALRKRRQCRKTTPPCSAPRRKKCTARRQD